MANVDSSGSAERAVHLYTVRLDVTDARVADDLALLSPDEFQRANAILDDGRRARFVRGRVALRRILAPFARAEPGVLRFDYGPHGKPVLRGANALFFNMAHSGDVALVAVTTLGAVGVDIERLRPVPKAVALATRILGNECAAALSGLQEDVRAVAFLRLWTHAEAEVKAIGASIMERRSIAVLPVARAVPAPDNYIAAVAVDGTAAWHITAHTLAS